MAAVCAACTKNLCSGQGFLRFMYKTYISLGAFVAIVIGVFVVLSGGADQVVSPVTTTAPSVQAEATTTAKTIQKIATPPRQTGAAQIATRALGLSPVLAPNITFLADGVSYDVYASEHSTVLDAMRVLASTSDFRFTGRDYPSLGFFVESIGGKSADNGYVWILYVNNKKSALGASQMPLGAGDAVEWRYEQSY